MNTDYISELFSEQELELIRKNENNANCLEILPVEIDIDQKRSERINEYLQRANATSTSELY